jgi:hypothetical protein
MFAYRIKTIINQDSSLNLNALPFTKGESVEIIILKTEEQKTVPPIQKPFVPFPAIKMRGQGDTAAEMVIKDRL